MTPLEILGDLVRAAAAGAGPVELAAVLERLTLSTYLGIFTSQEPVGFRLLLSPRARQALGAEGERSLASAVSEAVDALSGAVPERSSPPEPLELLVRMAAGKELPVACFPALDGEAVVGGVLSLQGPAHEAPAIRQIVNFVHVLLSRASLEAQKRAHEKALDLLNEIYRHNLEEQEAGAALGVEFTLSRLADLFHFDAAALALPDGERWKLLCWLAVDTPQPFIEAVKNQTLMVLSRDQAGAASGVEPSMLWQHRPAPCGTEPRSYFMLPLLFDPQGRRPGTLALYSASEDLLTPDEMRLLVLLTPGLSIAFRNSQLLFALERQAKIDEMSGLYNYRTFRHYLGREFQRVVRYATPLSLLLLDIDHFKAVNDTYGHQKGDDVLRGLARVLMEGKRGIDTVARYGGEEFVMILPETDSEGATKLAERIRSRVAQDKLLPDRPLTVSIGVATVSGPDAGSEDDLIHRSDKALYRAKNSGRNRVELG